MCRCGVWSKDDHYRWQTDQTADLGYGNKSVVFVFKGVFLSFEMQALETLNL